MPPPVAFWPGGQAADSSSPWTSPGADRTVNELAEIVAFDPGTGFGWATAARDPPSASSPTASVASRFRSRRMVYWLIVLL